MDDITKKFANIEGLSDIHIRPNKPISTRINGEIVVQEDTMVSENQINLRPKLITHTKSTLRGCKIG